MSDANTNDIDTSEIDASKAPLMAHLIELRQRLIYSVIAFFAMFVVCFAFAGEIFDILLGPLVAEVGVENTRTIYTHLLEKFFTELKIGMFGAAFLSFPVVAIQIYKFVAPGLYANERFRVGFVRYAATGSGTKFSRFGERSIGVLRCELRTARVPFW